MSDKLFLQRPDEPINEVWIWETDLQTSFDGTEEATQLLLYPRRSFSGVYSFDDADDLRDQIGRMFTDYEGKFFIPLWQYGVKLKQLAIAGANSVVVNSLRSDFKQGGFAVIVEGSLYDLIEITTVEEDGVTFDGVLANTYSARAHVCPVVQVFSRSMGSMTRRNPNAFANVRFQFEEPLPTIPFVNVLNDAALTMFDGFAVMPYNAIGSEFDATLNSGLLVDDYLNASSIVSPWDQAKWTYNRTFFCDRLFDATALNFWSVFAEYCQGSQKTFLLPSFRADLNIVTPAAGGANQLTAEGHLYSERYGAIDTFKRVVISSDAGRHYAKITLVTDLGGNDRITFAPALPAGAAWLNNQQIEFLAKARIADDRVSISHHSTHSLVTLSIRTVA